MKGRGAGVEYKGDRIAGRGAGVEERGVGSKDKEGVGVE